MKTQYHCAEHSEEYRFQTQQEAQTGRVAMFHVCQVCVVHNSWGICYMVSTESHVTIKYSHKTRNRHYWSMWITLKHYHEIKGHRTVNTARKHSAVTRKCLDVTNNSAVWNLAYTSWGLDISKILYQISWVSWKMQAKLLIFLKEARWIADFLECFIQRLELITSKGYWLLQMKVSSRVYELQNEIHRVLMRRSSIWQVFQRWCLF